MDCCGVNPAWHSWTGRVVAAPRHSWRARPGPDRATALTGTATGGCEHGQTQLQQGQGRAVAGHCQPAGCWPPRAWLQGSAGGTRDSTQGWGQAGSSAAGRGSRAQALQVLGVAVPSLAQWAQGSGSAAPAEVGWFQAFFPSADNQFNAKA